jgi:protein gp37
MALTEGVFQILTRRPVKARQVIECRYRDRGVPENLWFGTSVEDERVAARLNVMSKAKDRVGASPCSCRSSH